MKGSAKPHSNNILKHSLLNKQYELRNAPALQNSKSIPHHPESRLESRQKELLQKHMTLSVTGYYNCFKWQTWSLFYMIERKIFYPGKSLYHCHPFSLSIKWAKGYRKQKVLSIAVSDFCSWLTKQFNGTMRNRKGMFCSRCL